MEFATRFLHGDKITRSMRCSCKVILRTDALRKDKTGLVCLQVFIDGARLVINLGIYCLPGEFDKDSGRIRSGKPHASDYNLILGQAEARANKIFIDFRLEGLPLTKEIFKNEFTAPVDKGNFIQFFEKQLAERWKLVEKEKLEEGTYWQNKYVLDKLKKFSPKLSFADLTPAFLEDFDYWMKKELKNVESTRMKSMATLRIYVRMAMKSRARLVNPFEDFKIRKIESEVDVLTENELKRIYEYYISIDCKPQHRKVLTHFLFSCFTGLRVSDLGRITSKNIIENTLVFTPQKTKRTSKVVRVPIIDTARRFIEENMVGKVFEMFSDQYGNDNLKEIQKKLKISTDLHHHTGRHTFATVFLERGGKLEVLKDLLGHKDMRSTMVYVHVRDKRKQEQMKGMDDIL